MLNFINKIRDMAEQTKQQCYFFINPQAITPQLVGSTESFGVIDSNSFRVTSKFVGAGESMAYSICKGVVLIQPQGGDKVNLILRPYKQPFTGLNVKYFIYRGLKKSDFFAGENIVSTDAASDFIVKIQSDFSSFYSGSPPPFLSKFIGYDEDISIPLTTELSDFFFKESELTDSGDTVSEDSPFELPMIDGGKSLGKFASGSCGIDVVLQYGDYKNLSDENEFRFDLNYARAAESKIILSGSDFVQKVQREQIYQFIDIAAFYGLYVEKDIVKLNTGNSIVEKTGIAIYTDLLLPFASKNSWYVYIQSDRTRSYNYYGNYNVSDTDMNDLKLGTAEDALTESKFGTQGWPLLINTQTQTGSNVRNQLYLQFVTDNNVNTALYVQTGTIDNAQKNNFCNADFLVLPPDEEGVSQKFTKPVVLSIPATPQGKNICGFTKLLYQGVAYSFITGQGVDENGQAVAVTQAANFIDDVFDLIHAEPLFKGENGGIFKMASEKIKLVNEFYEQKQQGLSAVQTLRINDMITSDDANAPDIARTTYVTEALEIISDAMALTGKITGITSTSVSAKGNGSANKTYQLPNPYFYNLQYFTDSFTVVKGVILKTVDGARPNKVILGITDAQNNSLISLMEANLKNPRLYFADLFADGNQLLSTENIKYQKYRLGIVGERSGDLQIKMPIEVIDIYSLDRKYHFSKEYSEFMPEKQFDALMLDLDISL